jgi:hypothetical protein
VKQPGVNEGATTDLKLMLDQHEHVCALLEKELEHLQQAVERVTRERNRSREKHEALEARLETLTREEAQRAEQLGALQLTIEDLQEHQERMLEQLDAVRADHDRLAESSAEERRTLQDTLDSRNERIEALKAEYAAKIGQIEQRHQTARRQSERSLSVTQERAREFARQLDQSRREMLQARSEQVERHIRQAVKLSQSSAELLRLRFELLRSHYGELRRSTCWRLGNRAVRLIEIALLRWRKVLVTDHIEERFEAGSQVNWDKLDGDAKKALVQVSQGLEDNFEDLFQSKRWTLGLRLGTPLMKSADAREVREFPDRMTREVHQFKAALDAIPDDTATSGPPPVAAVEPGKISVIMPVYNGAGQVEQAIASVVAQSNRQWELLCVDDCSTDETLAILHIAADTDPRIRVLTHRKNLGKSVARNTGLSQARGEYIFFLDADDWLDPRALEHLLDRLNRDGVDMVIGQTFEVRDDTKERSEGVHQTYQHLDIRAQRPDEQPLLLENAIVCNKLIKRKFLDETGCWQFNEALDRFEDTEMCMRWYLHAPLVSVCREPTYFYRQHAGDTVCRSNRKPGGLEKAPLFRILMAGEILRYRADAQRRDDRGILSRQLLTVLRNLHHVGTEYSGEAWQAAARCASALGPTDLDSVSDEVRALLESLAAGELERAAEQHDELWPSLKTMTPGELQREASA